MVNDTPAILQISSLSYFMAMSKDIFKPLHKRTYSALFVKPMPALVKQYPIYRLAMLVINVPLLITVVIDCHFIAMDLKYAMD